MKRNKSWSKWTPQIIEEFTIDYPTMSWEDLLTKYPFAKSSMLSKASELGISRSIGRPPRYSKEEDELIKRCTESGMHDWEIAGILNRPVDGISCRRERLKIHRMGSVIKTRWTKEEERFLVNHYSRMSAAEIGEQLGRTRDAVVLHAALFGLKGYRDYHEYTPGEEAYIIENYLEMTDDEIGKTLGHPGTSIKNRRNRLGCHRPVEKSKYESASAFFRKHNTEWKTRSMSACGYKYVVTGERFDDIHHLFSLNTIIIDACNSAGFDISGFDPNNSSADEKKLFIDLVLQEQNKYPLGVCLSNSIHKDFHSKYGYGNNTPEQFIEFISLNYPECKLS